ncbi:MAG TPA: ABC transporter permease [Opitutaceae bacterium]|jgi:sodium transport system permease protein|nr:ABC transporter permease [Opitutaceae bacterium]
MNGHTIGTIYFKELRDSLRDRRTLISMIVLPTILMPLLMFGLGTAASRIVSKARTEVPRIMVIGGDDSPGVRGELEQTGKFKLEAATANWKTLVSDKKVRAAVEIPAGFEKGLKDGSAPMVTIYDYQGELKSGLAADQLSGFFVSIRERATGRLLTSHGLPVRIAKPFEVARKNVAPPEKVGGNLLGGIVPYIIVMLCIVGATYPAIDITAGEKERGTMETLLCSPARRSDIVLGKFLMVLTGSLSAVCFSLISLAGTVIALGASASAMAGGAPSATSLPSIDPMGLVGVLAMVLPVAVLFSAIIFSIALFAKSHKEAQSYVTPLILAVVVPCAAAILPGIELTYGLSLVPIANVSLVCKEMLSGVWHWGYIAVIFGSTLAYACAALAVAVRMFGREDVLFRT